MPQRPAPNQASINHDVELLKRYEIAKQTQQLEQFTTQELRQIAQLTKVMPSHEEGFISKTLKTGDQWNVPEIIGAGLGAAGGFGTGGPVGTALGAGAGAGLARYITERIKGSNTEDAVGTAAPEALMNAAIPAGGSMLKALGRGTMRTALPISDKMAEAQSGNRLNLHGGVDELVTGIMNDPGMTPKKAYDMVSALVSDAKLKDMDAMMKAEIAGKTISPQNVADKAMDKLNTNIRGSIHSPGQISGAEGVVDQFLENAGQHSRRVNIPLNLKTGEIGRTVDEVVPAPPMSPTRARDVLRKTHFVEGGGEVAGVKEGVRTNRKALSREYKDVVGPEAEAAMKVQSESIPKLELLDKVLVKGGPVAQGEILMHGFRPKIFGMINPSAKTRFTAGKILDRTGKVGSVKTSQLLEALAGILGGEDESD